LADLGSAREAKRSPARSRIAIAVYPEIIAPSRTRDGAAIRRASYGRAPPNRILNAHHEPLKRSSSEGMQAMLRIFQWVVRFFDWLRMLDDRIEAMWLNRGWPEFGKWWLGGSIGVGAFALLFACVPGAVLLEVNRFYQFLRFGVYPAAGLMYAGLWNFGVAFAIVAMTIAFVSCPFFMLQIKNRGH
jgi:hypothetical protein